MCAAFIIDDSNKFEDNPAEKLSKVDFNADIFGKKLKLTIGFADEPVQICDIVPAAQALCDIIVKASGGQQNTHRKKCRGCRNCAAVSAPEALWLQREINLMPNSERKVLQRSIELARRKENPLCPFLSEDTCTIYNSRPLVCREYNNQLPVSIFEAITCLCSELDESLSETIVLAEAIRWAQNSKDLLSKTYNMSELLGRLAEIIHQQSEKTAGVF